MKAIRSSKRSLSWFVSRLRLSSLTLNEPLYVLHTEHEQGRISTSKNKIKGLLHAYNKHSNKMNKSQKALHKFKLEFYKRGKKLSLKVL